MTITIWLLVAFGVYGYGGGAGAPAAAVERFPDAKECARVKEILVNTHGRPRFLCIEARVARP